mmetsp:Transcript_8050/g.16192  ORF Transcript_8050/g.16192 Transcript_8050/m.16192 type:complete len:505 (-) Transcript_8050:466-1980(-)|eukprot:CAMPEP_0171431792 /NCGR_PEP_ID=MMETSP0881-20121228/7472_1 /TAXON_ID=67004 /ORGANISM="Thalassiosira weissflogii, Strain CCMP1336" /LENGTH=504 /DNA_ID=CAMNT_0011952133 /DNA_START=1 /DNA_END=1515 /DNA_ORIENTATION=+
MTDIPTSANFITLNDPTSPLEAIQRARKLWLSATTPSDLEEVEKLYRWALSSKEKSNQTDSGGNNDDCSNNNCTTSNSNSYKDRPNKKKKLAKGGDCGLTREQFVQAGEKLALLLCQSGRSKKAKKGLSSMGFTCRLAKLVLDYPYPIEGEQQRNDDCGGAIQVMVDGTRHIADESKTARKILPPCQIIDGFLSTLELKRLRSVFESPTASYWTEHNYAVEPPSPYFSYVIPLSGIINNNQHLSGIKESKDKISSDDRRSNHNYGFLGELLRKIILCPLLNQKFPKLSDAAFVEMWAHNRPHASGHQMHFDSDDEGRGGVRNPIISTILYVSAGKSGFANVDTKNVNVVERSTGGPSLVTNQKLSDTRLATRGWLAHPKPHRLVAFDGRYLHGVVPGKGVQEGRRVTLMFAFWQDIRIRNEKVPGSARPFPTNETSLDSADGTVVNWAKRLIESLEKDVNGENQYKSCAITNPIELDGVYETLDGTPWKRGMGMPSYDQVFQGF